MLRSTTIGTWFLERTRIETGVALSHGWASSARTVYRLRGAIWKSLGTAIPSGRR